MAVRYAWLALALVACHRDAAPPEHAPVTVRCAVIGGMLETGLWPELAARFHAKTGDTLEVVSSGPKQVVDDAFRKGGIDVVTFHASDAFVNLVADGLAVDPQPWVRNDLVIVGPADDPAHIRGLTDAEAALRALIAAGSPIVIHASMGADGVLHDLSEATHLPIPAAQTIVFAGENQHAILDQAAAAHAYTLVGRIPFLDGKLHTEGIELMVKGDPRLRRPYLVATSPHASPEARALVAFMRSPETQAWIGQFGRGRFDAGPLFFPVDVK